MIGSSIQLRLLVVGVAAVVMFLGITQLRDMPLDLYPEFSPPYVEVQTEALGLSAEEVEQLITVPLEADLLNRVAWLQEIRSESIPGLSSVTMIFEPGTDLFRARQVVQEQLTQAHALPNVSKPPTMLQPLSSTSRVMKVGLKSDQLSLIEMSVLARWTMKPRLMGVPGVANVSIWGQRKRQLQVQVDPEHLRDKGVTLHQVVETTGNALWVSPLTFLEASVPGTGGFIDTPNQRLGVRHVLPISSPGDLERVAVLDGDGLTLGDVATVVENHQPLIGDALIGDEPGLMLVIEKFPWANTVEVTRGVEKALSDMAPAVAGISYDTQIYRPATFIEMALGNLRTVSFLGLGLVALALLAFLFSWRSTLIGLVSITASIATAAFILNLRGAPFDTMVLAGLAVALAAIIDDAIIDVENILRRLRERGEGQSALAAIVRGAFQMRGATGFGLVIMLALAVPVLAMPGMAGAVFKPIATSYMLAIAVSMLVALTVTPALSSILLGRVGTGGQGSPLVSALGRIHDALLSPSLRSPAFAIAGIAALAIVGLVTLPRLERDASVPVFRERDLLVRFQAAPGTSHPEMVRLATAAGKALRDIPGVHNVGSHVGRAIMSDEVVNVNSGELWVSLKPNAGHDLSRPEAPGGAGEREARHRRSRLRSGLGRAPREGRGDSGGHRTHQWRLGPRGRSARHGARRRDRSGSRARGRVRRQAG
jgi:Cu/Ag efflux pump CusA